MTTAAHDDPADLNELAHRDALDDLDGPAPTAEHLDPAGLEVVERIIRTHAPARRDLNPVEQTAVAMTRAAAALDRAVVSSDALVLGAHAHAVMQRLAAQLDEITGTARGVHPAQPTDRKDPQ